MGKYNNILHKKDFEHQLLDLGRPYNMATSVFVALYLFFLSNMFLTVSSIYSILGILIVAIATMTLLQFTLAPYTNHLITFKISNDLNNIDKKDCQDRTNIVRRLMKLPFYVSLQVFLAFILGCVTFILITYFLFNPSHIFLIFAIIPSIFCSYLAGVISYCYTENLSTKYSETIIRQGVDDKIVNKEKVFGMTQNLRVFAHIIIPATCCNLIQLQTIARQYFFPIERSIYIAIMISLTTINVSICIILASLYYRHLIKSINQMNNTLEQINSLSIAQAVYLPTDLGTEFAYTIYITNTLIGNLQKIISDINKTGDKLFKATQSLSVISKETASTALVQSDNVKNCVTTMNELHKMLEKIAESIIQVALEAENTSENVHKGSDMLQNNIEKISEITRANIDTITGIKMLSEKIDNVWSIISTIDSIAEKTRIIAFNAEIEATTAGDSGENFHIIANEIRRLASTITDSTKEIRTRITGIQHSSDNLIITSEGGTEKIREGSMLFTNLEEKFDELRTSSEITAESAADIQQITSTLDASFAQISSTLEQMSSGFDNFTNSAQIINLSADSIKNVAYQLNSIQTKEDAGE